jgi:hypothetical protein
MVPLAWPPVGRSASGVFYSYSKGVDLKNFNLKFSNIYNTEKDDLIVFFNLVQGSQYTFTYIDHNGTSWTARFLNTELNFEEVNDEESYTYTFPSSSNNLPTTCRKNQIWNINIELEVS